MIPNKRTFFFIAAILKINNILTRKNDQKFYSTFITSLNEHLADLF